MPLRRGPFDEGNPAANPLFVVPAYNVVFSWTPGHVGIVGNELADQAAKSATQKTTVDILTVPVRDV